MLKPGLVLLALGATLAACGPAVPRPRSAPEPRTPNYAPPPTRPNPPSQYRPEVQVMEVPGVTGVIGATARSLVGQFGTPRLDVHEGDARKLQFSGEACVLDIYLYPPRDGAEPVATHIDARRASDGRDVDRAACVNALRGR